MVLGPAIWCLVNRHRMRFRKKGLHLHPDPRRDVLGSRIFEAVHSVQAMMTAPDADLEAAPVELRNRHGARVVGDLCDRRQPRYFSVGNGSRTETFRGP